MRTQTILDAYMQAKAREYGINFKRRGRQAVTFRAALLRRIEAGDRAREALVDARDQLLIGKPLEAMHAINQALYP